MPYSSIAVDLNKVISSWSANQKLPTLDCVSVCFKKNQICAIIGPVGCGKVIIKLKCGHNLNFISGSYTNEIIVYYSHHYLTQYLEKYQQPLG